ncbi:hypothetical protein ACSTS3_22660 [Aquimarina muelleri]|uniref:hypothetical protein n=1 Tax=Aquimarina muelleri TaxID=279356 RepID=UPI003F6827D0
MQQNQYIISNPPHKIPVVGAQNYTLSLHTKITGIEKPVDTVLTYDVTLEYAKNYFAWKKSNIKINTQKVPEKISELYQKATSPLNTLEFQCTQGKINTVYDYEKLLESWEQTKEEIQQQFIGNPVPQIIEQLDQNYHNIKTLEKQLNHDPVLEIFYRSFLSDHLLYYGQSTTTFKSATVLKNTQLPFKAEKTLSMLEDQLRLQTQATLYKKETETALLQRHFANKVDSFTIDAVAITIEEDTVLNYKTVWIEQTKSIQTVTIGNYKKEIILTLHNA